MDLHVQIDVTAAATPGSFSRALVALRKYDPDFPDLLSGQSWWHKPPDRARSVLARFLSRYGLTGRVSVVGHVDGTPWDAPPPPRWTGFTARR